ncbi:MAG: oligoribonuclease [Promicromonosporaceae bacterium]|nr:oligoribonuclease [Promicromonosporaceae bacterium]
MVSANGNDERIVWVDCEMTGLDPAKDALLEIAVVVTDADLKPFDGGVDLVIQAPPAALEHMSALVRDMHTKSGLLAEVKEGGVPLADAAQAVMDYVKMWVPEAGTAPLAGNSVGVDKAFLSASMPQLVAYLNYRIIDVSTFKELARRWYDRVWQCAPAKTQGHRALQDIWESIDELRYYRTAMMVPAPGPTSADLKKIAAEVLETSVAGANDLY